MDYKTLNKYSPTFCAAKWTQVTIDLQHGTTHSCHHPIRHKIPLSELKKDVHALHDTKYKKKQRAKMLKGKRPKECSYCWNIEDASEDNISDRYIKSFDSWSYPHLDEIAAHPVNENYAPKYLEIFFSSKCNLSCSYCMADVSSSIEKEMERFGPYPVKDKVVKKHRQYTSKRVKDLGANPYVEAFWKWLPEIYKDLKVLRLTGGEPLLDDNFDKLLDYIITNPHEGLTFAVNSNLCVSQNLVDNMFEKLNMLQKKANIKIELYTSLDTHGKQAEYIRSGLNYHKVIENIKRFQYSITDGHITVMCCFNILSFDSFEYFLDDILKLKENSDLLLDISYLKDPMYLCSKMCSKEQLDKLELLVKKMESSNFTSEETKKLKRIYIFLKSLDRDMFLNERRDFNLFIDEYDKRKKMTFKEVFPSFLTF